MDLTDRRLLITGVLTDDSIAYAVAERAQALGAEIVLTGFGRGLRITQRIARRLPTEPPVLELDVNEPEHLAAVAADLEERWGSLDGILHAIAFAPQDALGGNFLDTPAESALIAFGTSAYSLKSLAVALLPLLERSERAPGIVGLDFDATVAWPVYDWMGVAKAAMESVNRYLARDLGPKGVRSNLVVGGPAAHDGRPRHRRLRPPRGPVERAGAAALGRPRRRTGRRRRPVPALRGGPRRSPARSCTSTAATTRSARR